MTNLFHPSTTILLILMALLFWSFSPFVCREHAQALSATNPYFVIFCASRLPFCLIAHCDKSSY